MAHKLWTSVYLIAVFCITQVYGYYCDSGRCGADKYCCGVNICCTSYTVWQMWYFWCGLVFFLVLLSACAGFCRYRYYETAVIIHSTNPYARLPNDNRQNLTEVYTDYPAAQSQRFPPASPPKYTQMYAPPPYSPSTAEK